jgi:hypothetical protein
MLVKMEVYHDGKNWCARGIGEDVITQGDTVDRVFENIREAVALHLEGRVAPSEVDILIVSELKPIHAPAASS